MESEVRRFENRLRVLLPETYQLFDDEVQPRSMGSAGLKYGEDGKVLWDKMWGSFCDLAMAGGPPHRGKLLEPVRDAPITPEQQAAMRTVSAEICRGIGLVTGSYSEPAPVHGWLRMYCTSAAMAGWLARAIMMENVTAITEGLSLFLPTGPNFRIEKEIKNVITSAAKTCHYWQDHMSDAKHDEIAELLASMDREGPLLQPAVQTRARADDSRQEIGAAIQRQTALEIADHYVDWLGIECKNVAAAIWMMRALVATNCISRREDTIVFVPVNAAQDIHGERTVATVAEVYHLACAYGVFP